MLRALPRVATIVIALILTAIGTSSATTVVPVSDADLAASASLVVRGRVTAIASHWDAGHKQVFTDVTLAVDDVLSGPALGATVTLRQPGGSVGGLHHWIEGSPEFYVGEAVLVFLATARDGTLRVAHLFQGKFSIVGDPFTGDELAVRTPGPGVRVMAPRTPATGPRDTRRLEDLRATVRALRRHAPVAPQMQTAPLTAGAIEQTSAFTFNGTPSRWFEPDSGRAIAVYTNSAGEPRAPTLGFDQVRQGLAAWSNDPLANFRYQDAGLTSVAGVHLDGVSTFTFGDPDGVIDPPVNCSGTLAMGGFFRSSTESQVLNGQTYMRILEGDIVIADGWQGCGFYETFANVAETATHELGHVLGLGHSTDPDATMYAVAHFDGRGASLRSDDLAGLRFLYPAPASTGALSVAITQPSPGATVSGVPWAVMWVTGASGASNTFTLTLGGRTVGGGTTSSAGPVSLPYDTRGVPDGVQSLTVTVRDATGATGSQTVSVSVRNGTTSPPLTASITTPAAGATVSGTITVSAAASGGTPPYSYALNVDGARVASSASASFTWNSAGAANGGHTLSVTVTDSAGGSVSPAVGITVSNGATPPPPPPSGGTLKVFITQPTAGATVSGTNWVTLWLQGATSGSNTYTLTVAGQTVAISITSSTGPVTMAWTTSNVADGAQTLTATVRDASGNTGAASVGLTVANGGTVPPPLPSGGTASLTLAYNGMLRDRVGTNSTALSADGALDGTLTMTLTAAGGRTITSLALQSSAGGGMWDTIASTGQWILGVATSLDGALLNNSATMAVNVPVADGGSLVLFGSDNAGRHFVSGATLTLSATFSDGSTAQASTTISGSGGGGSTPPPPPPPPPPSTGTLRVFLTSPTAGASVSGVVWANIWLDGASGSANVYTLLVDGASVITQTDPGVHVTLPWTTTGAANGSHTLSATVRDATGNTGSTSITVTVGN